MTAEFLTAPSLGTVHGFFTRRGGVSQGPYASLNASLSGGDDPGCVAQNRALMASALQVGADRLVGVTQVHGCDVETVRLPWQVGAGPRADAMVTDTPGLALGVVTADCAPVLFHDAAAAVIGAAHAGWRGAVSGVLEATIKAMERLGATRSGIVAAIGPCIGQASYEVGDDLRMAVLAASLPAERFFTDGARAGHWQFDLPGYCLGRLQAAGVAAHGLGLDTCAEVDRFFSHRRRTLAGGGPIGHQLSAIVLHGDGVAT
jgi:YfiH family protein